MKKASSLVGDAAPAVRTSEQQTYSNRRRLTAASCLTWHFGSRCNRCTGDRVCNGISPDASGASAGEDGALPSGVDAFAGEVALIASDPGRNPDGREASRRSCGAFAGEGIVAPTSGEMAPTPGELPIGCENDAFAGELTPFAGDLMTSAIGTLTHWRWGPCTRWADLAVPCVCRWALASWRRERDSLPRLEKPPTPCFSRRCLKSFVREVKCTTFPHCPSQLACFEASLLCVITYRQLA